ncbi:MAG: DNA recombination protein RmuC, partial [Bacteroidota bacterium]
MDRFDSKYQLNIKDLNEAQKLKLDDVIRQQQFIRRETEDKLNQLRSTVEEKLDKIQQSNESRLEKIRATVDEKLHDTLEKRLTESFKLVSERLEAVQNGLGEMKDLATGVGDLKKVLTNVKTRGTLGEIQLGNILEQILAPEQYEANVSTKPGESSFVEYAIKLPGKETDDHTYLPIDAKFPQEDFIRLQDAYHDGDREAVERHTTALRNAVLQSAKQIKDKYISPPHTTDFGVLFLPVEGLYAEVARQPELLHRLQTELKIVVAGPTTLAAMLNSLQLGFKTLAIQKRSSEVWKTLTGVKVEFGKFAGV